MNTKYRIAKEIHQFRHFKSREIGIHDKKNKQVRDQGIPLLPVVITSFCIVLNHDFSMVLKTNCNFPLTSTKRKSPKIMRTIDFFDE